MRFNKVEFAAGAAIFAIGVGVILEATRYRMGTLTSMGPGMFPVILGSIFALFGIAIIFEGRRATTTFPEIPLRPIIAITLAVIAFALTITRFGLLPALLLLVFFTSLAESRIEWRPVAITLVILGLVAVLTLTLLPNAFNLRLLIW